MPDTLNTKQLADAYLALYRDNLARNTNRTPSFSAECADEQLAEFRARLPEHIPGGNVTDKLVTRVEGESGLADRRVPRREATPIHPVGVELTVTDVDPTGEIEFKPAD